MKKLSQQKVIAEHLLGGMPITDGTARRLYGIGRLAARISELKTAGMPIESRFITVNKREGETARVKEYWIERSN